MKCFEPSHNTPFSATLPSIIQIKKIILGNNRKNFRNTLRTKHQIKLLLRTFIINVINNVINVHRKYQ